jgi:hypothetical protein
VLCYPENLWKIIRNIDRSKCCYLPNYLVIDDHDQKITNPYDIANIFNGHFANITASVKLNDNPNPNWDYLTNF